MNWASFSCLRSLHFCSCVITVRCKCNSICIHSSLSNLQYDSVGNRRFRVLVELNLEKYSLAKTKMEKSVIVMGILDTVRDSGGDFVRFNPKTKKWFICKDVIAREKTGQQFRAAILAKEAGAEAPQSRSSICSVSRRMSKSTTAARRCSSVKSLAPKRVSLQAQEMSSLSQDSIGSFQRAPQEFVLEALLLEPLPLRGNNRSNIMSQQQQQRHHQAAPSAPVVLHSMPTIIEEQCRMFAPLSSSYNTMENSSKSDVDGPDDDDMLRILDAAIRWTKRPAPVPSRRVSYETIAL